MARISVRSSILSDDEVRDIGTADNSEPPVLGRGQDVITASLVPDRIASSLHRFKSNATAGANSPSDLQNRRLPESIAAFERGGFEFEPQFVSTAP